MKNLSSNEINNTTKCESNLFTDNKINNSSKRIGIGKDKLTYCDNIDFCNDEIAKMFNIK